MIINDYIGLLELSEAAEKSGKSLSDDKVKLLWELYQKNIDDYRTVLKTPEGRRVLWRLIRRARFYSHGFIGNSEAFYREGLQYIGGAVHNDATTAGGGHAILDVMQQEEEELFKNELEKLTNEQKGDD